MNGKAILASAIEVIALLFAVFGQFLTKAAPPAGGLPDFAVGVSSFLMLGVLLFIVAMSRRKPSKRVQQRWLVAAGILFVIVATAGFSYQHVYDRFTFEYPLGSGGRYVRGSELTEYGRRHLEATPPPTVQEMVANSGGVRNLNLLWSEESVQAARLRLSVQFALVTVTIAAMVCCLTEGILAPSGFKVAT